MQEAVDKGLEIDHDDSLAIAPNGRDFALLLHGTQPVGTPAAKAWSKLMRDGIGGDSDFRRTYKVPPHVVFYLSVSGKRSRMLPNELPEKYVIVGPEDHNELRTFWNINEGWVEFELASKFDVRILSAPLPPEAQYMIDTVTFTKLAPTLWEGFEKSEKSFETS